MAEANRDEQYSEDETERRASEAIRRSFHTPYKPQKELVGKTAPLPPRKRSPSSAAKKPK